MQMISWDHDNKRAKLPFGKYQVHKAEKPHLCAPTKLSLKCRYHGGAVAGPSGLEGMLSRHPRPSELVPLTWN